MVVSTSPVMAQHPTTIAEPSGPVSAVSTPVITVGNSSDGSDEEKNLPLSESPEDEEIYADLDGAQQFMQPAISPIATRLASARTPAAEKAAAMEESLGSGYFQGLDSVATDTASSHPPQHLRPLPLRQEPLPDRQPARSGTLPAPWAAGPKEFMITEPASPRNTSLSGVFQTRQERSSSGSEKALKRLSNLIPNISTPFFFSSFGNSFQKDDHSTPVNHIVAEPQSAREPPADLLVRPESRNYGLRKSTSDDSLLYHSLSRVSSFGDDERFVNVREQVNSRFKAIKDSFDGPSFKMPQIHNLLAVPPRKHLGEQETNGLRTGFAAAHQRTPRDGATALDIALESLTGDIVVMGGYRGSILRSAKPPYRRLWVPVKVGLKIRKVHLEVGLDPKDEEDMESHIFASGMLQNIGPVDISRRLFKKLRECENARTGRLRVHDYGYDWRLSPHLLSKKLADFLKTLPSNQPSVPASQRGAFVIAHSLGGLITRHAINRNPELFSGVVFAGTPRRCINVLGPLRNGDAVLLNEKVLTAQVNFTLRTTFAFLPEDGFCFVDKTTKEEYPVDFYNVDEWVKYRLSPCVSGPALPPLTRSSTFGSLLSLSESLPSLPLRARSLTHHKKNGQELPHRATETGQDPISQLGASVTAAGTVPSLPNNNFTFSQTPSPTPGSATQSRNLAYLRRTLAEIKQFRSELAHNPQHQEANIYPPLAVIYAKDIPTVYAARVASREAIACADAYDDLVFRSGDGVVLAKESMLPEGYELVRDGRICTDRGHVSMLGDLNAVGRALEAVMRGRMKGIGIGKRG